MRTIPHQNCHVKVLIRSLTPKEANRKPGCVDWFSVPGLPAAKARRFVLTLALNVE